MRKEFAANLDSYKKCLSGDEREIYDKGYEEGLGDGFNEALETVLDKLIGFIEDLRQELTR